MPPERGQTLAISVLAAVTCLPLMPHVAWQVSVFVVLILLLRLVAFRWPGALPGRTALFLLTLVGVLNCLATTQGGTGKPAWTGLLITMVVLKLLELRERRDHRTAAIVLALLIVIQFLFGQGLGLTVFLACSMVASVGALVNLNGGLGEEPLHQTLRVTARLALQALPLTLILFLSFPRLEGPLWNLAVDRDTALTGMGDTMEPGSISELVINGDLAFRARFEGRTPAADRMYWRGLVLWEVDDRRWRPGPVARRSEILPHLEVAQDILSYEVMLEPSRRTALFALDLPVEIPRDSTVDRSFQLAAVAPWSGTRRYSISSALEYRTADASADERVLGLRLPPTVSARQRALAAEWAARAGSDWELVQEGLEYFREQDFRYTLLPPRLPDRVWDRFLFESKSGFCEHFAGSFAVMMRLGGIPARVVIGYLGGEPNRIGGHLMIWQADAHAWVEVLIAGRGWVRVDPTAVIATSRIDRQGAARLLGSGGPARFQIEAPRGLAQALRQLRDLKDTLDAAWQDWVLDFSSDRQLALLDGIGLEGYGQWALVGLMLSASAAASALILLGLLRQPRSVDPWVRGYAEFCRRLSGAGLTRKASEGPSDFSARVAVARPDLAVLVGEITGLYVANRYGPQSNAGDAQRLRSAVNRFRPRRIRSGTGWRARVHSGPGSSSCSGLFPDAKSREDLPK